MSTGLLYYGARYYDPALGRFISADTVVPEPGNPQALNRFSYVLNNPLRYTDPSGHKYDPHVGETWTPPPPPPPYLPLAIKESLHSPHQIQAGDIILENNRNPVIPGDWDHAVITVDVNSEDPSLLWVVEAGRNPTVWQHEIDLDTYGSEDWVVLRVDTTSKKRKAAAGWAERLAGWDGAAERRTTSGDAPFTSLFPFRNSPWGWLDPEGYYCFEVPVAAYQAQGIDITGRTQQLEIAVQYYPYAVVDLTMSYVLPYYGQDIYSSPNTYVITRK